MADRLGLALKVAYGSELYQGFLVKQGMGSKWLPADDMAASMATHDQVMGRTLDRMGLKRT